MKIPTGNRWLCLRIYWNLWRTLEVGHHQFLLTCIEIHWRAQLVLVKVCDSGQPKSSTTMHLCCHSDFIIPQIKSTMQEIWSIEPQFLLVIQVYWNSLLWIKTVFIISFIYWLHQHPSPDGECSSSGAPAPLSWVIEGFGSRVPLSILVATDVYIPYLSLKVHLWCC